MLRTIAYSALCGAALIGTSVYAADNPAPAPTPAADAPAQAQGPSGVNFVTRQEISQWRAPKLIGVGVYGSDDKQIGKIDDLLVNKDGSAQTIVIGVGGFLGFGKKDVAVPFSAMQWRTEARKAPASDQPPSSAGNPTAPATTSAQQPVLKETDPATAEASQGYPDKAILNVTLDQLKAAPDFSYASSAMTASEARPSGGDAPMKRNTP